MLCSNIFYTTFTQRRQSGIPETKYSDINDSRLRYVTLVRRKSCIAVTKGFCTVNLTYGMQLQVQDVGRCVPLRSTVKINGNRFCFTKAQWSESDIDIDPDSRQCTWEIKTIAEIEILLEQSRISQPRVSYIAIFRFRYSRLASRVRWSSPPVSKNTPLAPWKIAAVPKMTARHDKLRRKAAVNYSIPAVE